MPTRKRAFTIVELLIVVAIIALLIAILLPAITKARDTALTTQSQGNMKNLGSANASYGADWTDRQWTAIPDDFGMAPGANPVAKCTYYVNQIACPPQQILGWDEGGGLWGYWIGQGLCIGTIPLGCQYNATVLYPVEYVGPNMHFGAFRMPNVKSFNDYVNGRFYDKIFYAPKDRLIIERATPGLQHPGEFSILPGLPLGITYSTYCWSPSAMFAPDVHAHETGYQNPDAPNMPGAFRSPTCGQAAFPDLKTRMIEHTWLQNKDGGDRNGGWLPQPWWWNDPQNTADAPPWLFNQGTNSAPVTLFFDGHISLLPCTKAIASDERVKAQQAGMPFVEKGLWVRNTPMGVKGYFGTQAFDQEIFDRPTSFHMLTTDGILGRDLTGDR